MCAACKKIQCTVSDVQTNAGGEHLFLVTSSLCTDMVGILHAIDVHRHIFEDGATGRGAVAHCSLCASRGKREPKSSNHSHATRHSNVIDSISNVSVLVLMRLFQ